MKTDKKKALLNIALHLVFWVGVCYFFTHFSSLRPMARGSLYKEFVTILFILIMVYFNYFYLTPKYFQAGKLKQFWIFSTLNIIITGVCEIALIYPEINKILVGSGISELLIPKSFRTILFLIILRDFGFFLFFFLLKLHNDLAAKYIQTNQAIAEETQSVFIQQAGGKVKGIKISAIAFISQEGNRSCFHLIDGKQQDQYTSLSKIEQQFPENTCLRINKSNLVIISNIISYDNENVKVNMKEEDGSFVTLKISDKHRNDVLPILDKHKNQMLQNEKNAKAKKNKRSVVNMRSNDKKNNNMNAKKRSKIDSDTNEKSVKSTREDNTPETAGTISLTITSTIIFNSIKDYNIKNKKGCRVPFIEKDSGFAPRTIQTHTRLLKDLGLIEYRGAPKNGGYYLSSKGKVAIIDMII